MAKAKWCDECKYFKYPFDESQNPYCKKGHKPRFYKPKRIYSDYGFKRRCDDFELGDHVITIKLG